MPVKLLPPLRTSLSIAVLALLVACGESRDQGSDGAISRVLGDCPGFAETGSPPLVSGARCGSLDVPLDSAEPGGEVIALNILLLPAIAPAPEPDPLFILVGGPGQAAVEQAEMMLYALGDIRHSRDLVFVDQRGTGESAPLDCDLDKERSPGMDMLVQRQRYLDAMADCAEKYRDRTAFFTTPQAADDLNRVRLALGYEQINLWGISYGTRLALEVMRRHGKSVRSAVLDGLAPVAIALPWHIGEDAQRALALLHDHCAADDWCAQTHGPLLPRAETIARHLASAPVAVDLAHPRTGRETRVQLTEETFTALLRLVLYSRDLSRLLPAAVSRAHGGDYRTLAALWLLAEGQEAHAGIYLGLHYTVICAEDYPLAEELDLAAAAPLLGLNLAATFAEVCQFWPAQPPPDDYYQPVSSDTPTLLLSGRLDPVTPPHWGERVAETLSDSRHLVAPGSHHGVTFDGCVRRLIGRFVDAGHYRDLDTSCVEDIALRPPLRDRGEPDRD